MAIARVSLHKRIKALNFNGILWVNTVHDSIVLDIKTEIWLDIQHELCYTISKVFEDIPSNFKRLFDLELNVPVCCEISFGPDCGNLEEYHETKHQEVVG